MGFWAHIVFLSSLLGLGITWAKAFVFLLSPRFLLYCRGPFWSLILLYHFVVLLHLCLSLYFLWADIPAVSTYFVVNPLLRASLAHLPCLLPLLRLLVNILAVLACFTILFIGLPQPIYLFFTSFYSMGFLLNSLSFLDIFYYIFTS